MAKVHVGYGEKMSDSPRGGGSQRVSVPEGINLLHNEGKLLYLLSRYASAAPEGALAVAALAVAYVLVQRRRSAYAVRFTELSLLASVAPTCDSSSTLVGLTPRVNDACRCALVTSG